MAYGTPVTNAGNSKVHRIDRGWVQGQFLFLEMRLKMGDFKNVRRH